MQKYTTVWLFVWGMHYDDKARGRKLSQYLCIPLMGNTTIVTKLYNTNSIQENTDKD